MSSDGYRVSVLSKKNNVVVLRVATGFAGGRNDYASTRSFALFALTDARRRFNETDRKELSKGVRFRKVKSETALEKAQSKWPRAWQFSEAFYKETVGNYVVKTTILARHNKSRSNDFSSKDHDFATALENETLSLSEVEHRLCERFHFIELEVEMADKCWLDGIEEGWIFGTAAYDVVADEPSLPTKAKAKASAKQPARALAGGKTASAKFAKGISYADIEIEADTIKAGGFLTKPSGLPRNDISDTDFSRTTWRSPLRSAKLHDSKRMSARRCNFDDAKFPLFTSGGVAITHRNIDLRDSTFRGAVLNTLFWDCDLSGVDFSGADLGTTTFDNCKFAGANFTGAKVERAYALVNGKEVPMSNVIG